MARRIKRFDVFLTKNFSVSDNRQIPAASADVDIYLQGATANGSGSIAPAGSGNVTVRHPGRIAVGNVVFFTENPGNTGTVNSVTATTINVTDSGSGLSWASGDHLVPIVRPSTFVESTGNVATADTGHVLTDSLGHAFFYAEEESVTLRYSTDGGTTIVWFHDLDGAGGNVHLSNEFDGASAVGFLFKLKRALTTGGAKLLQILSSADAELFSIDKDGKIPIGSIPTLTSSQLGTDSVTSTQIAADAVGSSEIAASAVTTSELATAAAASFPAQGKNASNQTISSGSYGDVTGCSVTLTPDSAGSVFFIIGTLNVRYLGGTAGQAIAKLLNSTDVVDLDEKAQVLTTSTDNPGVITLVARVTGITGSHVFKIQAKMAGGLSSYQIDGTTPNFAQISVVEFKKAV